MNIRNQIGTAIRLRGLCMAAVAFLVAGLVPADAQDVTGIKLTSAGPIAFGPDGVLLVSDPMAAVIYAVETGESLANDTAGIEFEVAGIRGKLAALMGAEKSDVRIDDLAVNPNNGKAYLSVSRGSGSEQVSAIMTVDPRDGKISEFSLDRVKFTKTTLPNAPESRQTRRGNQRMSSITDMAFIDGQVYVAGLSNEEFASNLRAIPFPFKEASAGSSIEIYHGAHGAYETRSPVRTFAAYEIDDEVNLLAAYTCTPLVRIPVQELKAGSKVKGTTIAELGNRNRPLDMVIYQKDGKDFALMANSARGVMKIDLANVGAQQAITTRISGGGTAGIKYETIAPLTGVLQLDGLNSTHAVILQKDDRGNETLRTVALP